MWAIDEGAWLLAGGGSLWLGCKLLSVSPRTSPRNWDSKEWNTFILALGLCAIGVAFLSHYW